MVTIVLVGVGSLLVVVGVAYWLSDGFTSYGQY